MGTQHDGRKSVQAGVGPGARGPAIDFISYVAQLYLNPDEDLPRQRQFLSVYTAYVMYFESGHRSTQPCTVLGNLFSHEPDEPMKWSLCMRAVRVAVAVAAPTTHTRLKTCYYSVRTWS